MIELSTLKTRDLFPVLVIVWEKVKLKALILLNFQVAALWYLFLKELILRKKNLEWLKVLLNLAHWTEV